MKTLLYPLLAAALSVVISHAKPPNLVEAAVGNPDFSTLVAALKAADLVDTVKDGTFTVLAPTNDAFKKLPKGTVENLLKPENKAELVRVLTYHAIPGSLTLDQLLAAKSANSVEGSEVTVGFKNGRVLVNESTLQTADITCANGVIHVIDAVLLPPPSGPGTLVETAVNAGSFNTLVAAVKAAGLAEALSTKELTVFAPTDDAFAALPKKTLNHLLTPEGKDELVNILTYHVVPGSVSAGDALNAGKAKALNGDPLAFTFTDGQFKVGKSRIFSTDIEASNGRIHVIDSVLLPPAKPARKSSMKSIEQGAKLIQIAIDHGVPIFNDGDTKGCATVYHAAGTHLMRLTDLPENVLAPMRAAMAKASKQHSSRDRSWTLRQGLDSTYRALADLNAEMEEQTPEPATTKQVDAKPPAEGVTTLIDFTGENPGKIWKTVNDNVMGGRSKGGPSFADGNLTFSGSTNTDGGGFSSIRTLPNDWKIDEQADGIVVRYKADGRTYQIDVRKRGVSDWTAYRAEFKTKKTWSWKEVRIPFSDFKPTIMGRPVKGQAIQGPDVEAIGFFIYDKKDGPFKLLVDWVGTYEDKKTASND